MRNSGPFFFMKGESSNNTLWKAIKYNVFGHITQFVVGNSIVTNKGYNANTGRITRINTTLGDNIFQDLMYSYDDFGNFALRRKMNSPVISETFTYDNINTTFDRGFCMHEHYRDFGLINMNGRMYDPLVGRMLSPDIVIQNPEYSQSYNRYSYCFNNPLRFTDPSGYVVRGRNDVLNPQYFIWLKSSNSKNGNSFNTDIVEGSPMMMEDNYTVDEQGYIKLVEKTNDDFDMLYTKASWDSGEKDDFIKLDKGILDKVHYWQKLLYMVLQMRTILKIMKDLQCLLIMKNMVLSIMVIIMYFGMKWGKQELCHLTGL